MGLAAVACVTTTAHAQFVPGDVLAGLEFVQEGGPGRVYRVTAGGDLTGTVPDFEMPTSHPVIDVCSTDDGRVLIATSTHQTIYDITSGTPVSFATIPVDASALYCGEGEIFVASFLLASQVFDITNGGDITEVYATGVERGLVRNVDGSMWGANFTGFDPGGGVFEGIAKGSDFSAKVPAIALTDVFATTVHDRRVFAAASVNDAIVDLSDGLPKFAHAIVPGVRGLASSDGQLWASTIEGKIFQVRASVDYTNKPAYATIPGPSLSMAVVQKCGDGLVHGREECDAGEATDECYATCKLARCGDAVINMPLGEACDDGNLESGDGCSETCEVETVAGSGGAGGSGGSASTGGTGGGAGGDESADDGGSGCSASGRSPTETTPTLLALAVAVTSALGRRRRSRESERRAS